MDGFFLFSRKVNAKRTPRTLEAELVLQVLQSSERWILLPCPSRMVWKKRMRGCPECWWNVGFLTFFCIVFLHRFLQFTYIIFKWNTWMGFGMLDGIWGGMLKTKQLSLFRTVYWVNGWINSCQLLQQNWVQGAFKKGFLKKNFQSNLTLQLPK